MLYYIYEKRKCHWTSAVCYSSHSLIYSWRRRRRKWLMRSHVRGQQEKRLCRTYRSCWRAKPTRPPSATWKWENKLLRPFDAKRHRFLLLVFVPQCATFILLHYLSKCFFYLSLSSLAVGAGVSSREDSWYYHILYGCEGQSHQSVSAVPWM